LLSWTGLTAQNYYLILPLSYQLNPEEIKHISNLFQSLPNSVEAMKYGHIVNHFVSSPNTFYMFTEDIINVKMDNAFYATL
jgi:hypothetical protein